MQPKQSMGVLETLVSIAILVYGFCMVVSNGVYIHALYIDSLPNFAMYITTAKWLNVVIGAGIVIIVMIIQETRADGNPVHTWFLVLGGSLIMSWFEFPLLPRVQQLLNCIAVACGGCMVFIGATCIAETVMQLIDQTSNRKP